MAGRRAELIKLRAVLGGDVDIFGPQKYAFKSLGDEPLRLPRGEFLIRVRAQFVLKNPPERKYS